jgi:hypothetical protein
MREETGEDFEVIVPFLYDRLFPGIGIQSRTPGNQHLLPAGCGSYGHVKHFRQAV